MSRANRRKKWKWNKFYEKRSLEKGLIEKGQKQSGYVYVFESNGAYKIGRAGNWEKRLRDIRCGNLDAKCKFAIRVEDCKRCERVLHKMYEKKWIEREWYRLSDIDLDAIKKYLNKRQPKGYSPHEHDDEPIPGIRFARAIT